MALWTSLWVVSLLPLLSHTLLWNPSNPEPALAIPGANLIINPWKVSCQGSDPNEQNAVLDTKSLKLPLSVWEPLLLLKVNIQLGEDKSMALAKYDIDTAVQLILCREKLIVKEVYKYLDYQDMLRVRRRELMHQKWVRNVGAPLQQLITQRVAATHLTAKEKLEAADNYLKYSNKMGRTFIDHYDPQEYDPFYMRNKDPAYLKVLVPLFRDPVWQAQQDRDEENRAILQCETGKRYTMKEFKEAEKARQLAGLPRFSFARPRRCPASAPAEGRGFSRSRAHARPHTVGRSQSAGLRHFPILVDAQEKAMSSARSTLDLDEVGSTKASSRAAEAWAHRPALLRSPTRPASHKVRHAYQERPAYIPSTGQAWHAVRRSAWAPAPA